MGRDESHTESAKKATKKDTLTNNQLKNKRIPVPCVQISFGKPFRQLSMSLKGNKNEKHSAERGGKKRKAKVEEGGGEEREIEQLQSRHVTIEPLAKASAAPLLSRLMSRNHRASSESISCSITLPTHVEKP
ncbi:hypothetical protein AMTR_s00120p00092290 [Amborella trichopoda]|uniref:Uncharacterized protein n=1 Tax=Amborella trichopoda TaxID=13333 RepID=W1NP29_AMBTC|nr:hypothetical protein AMTR_s00120p00092290 [Amborella trichopoda]